MSWWNESWTYRQRLYSVPSGSTYASGTHFLHFDLNLQNLVSMEMLRADYADIRVIYASGTEVHNIPYFIASGRSPDRIYFPAQNDIPQLVDIGSHGSGWSYHVYYGNNNGDTEDLPAAYDNKNFPQSPYSATTEWYWPTGAVSGYRDKCLYRFNDDPSIGSASGFKDAAGFTSGIAIFGGSPHPQSGVHKGKSGRLDLATEFDRSNRGSVKVIDLITDATVPSGDWCIDFWVYPYSAGGLQYWFVKKRNDNDNNYWSIASRFNYNATYTAYSEYTTQRRNVSQLAYNQWDAASAAGIEADEWTHIRLYYGKQYYGTWSCVYMYVNGTRKGATGLCGWPPSEPYFTQMSSGDCVIGGSLSTLYELDGKLEQFRYSTKPWFADLSYTPTDGNSRFAPPDWIDNEYDVTLGNLEVNGIEQSGTLGGVTQGALGYVDTSGMFGGYLYGRYQQTQDSFGGFLSSTFSIGQSGNIGGHLYSDAITHDPLEVGGFLLARAEDNIWYLGGFVNALPYVPQSGEIGGIVRSLADDSRDDIGGFMIGTWSIDGNSSVDGLARTLVKGAGDVVANQTFRSDAQFVMYAENKQQFDAKLRVANQENPSFDSMLEIFKVKKNPHIEIIDTQITGTGPWTVILIASGHAFDINNNAIVSGIHKADFVWTDGEITSYNNIQQSGHIFSSQHIFERSGIYKPIVVGYDKLYNRGSDNADLNFASGIGHPYITLSGTPRAGEVPPSLTVDFEHSVSGTLGSYTVWWDYANGITQYNNSPTTTTSYPMAGDYIPYIVLEDERNIPVVDTLRVGYNL